MMMIIINFIVKVERVQWPIWSLSYLLPTSPSGGTLPYYE